MIKSFTRDFIYGTIILTITGLLIYQFFNNPIKTENNVADIISLDKAPPIVYQDPTGKTHVKKEIIYVSDNQAALYYRSQRDSLAKQLGVKEEQIVGLTTASGKAEINFTPIIEHIKDSLKNTVSSRITYNSKWYDLYGRTDSLPFRTTFRDSISLAFIKDTYGFLNMKERFSADISSANPDMKYTNVKSWAVPQSKNNKARLGFGLTAGYGLQIRKNNDISHGLQLTGGLQLRF